MEARKSRGQGSGHFPKCLYSPSILPFSPFGWGAFGFSVPLLCLSQFVSQCEEEIPTLRAEVQQLQAQIQEPREAVFADVLLQRPKYVITLQLSQTRRAPTLATE